MIIKKNAGSDGQNIYVSNDGSEFEKEVSCRLHEESLLRQKITHISTLEWSLPCADPSYKYQWYYVKSQEEVDAINLCYTTRDEANEYDIPEFRFPQWICFEEDEGSTNVWFKTTYDEYLKQAKSFQQSLDFSAVCPSCNNAEHFPYSKVCSRCKSKEIPWPKAKLVAMALQNIKDNRDECEKLAAATLDCIDPDNTRPYRMGSQIIESYLAGDVEGLLLAITGWGMDSVLEFANNLERKEKTT